MTDVWWSAPGSPAWRPRGALPAPGRVGARPRGARPRRRPTLNATLGGGKVVEVGGQWVGPTQTRLSSSPRELGVPTFPTYDEGEHRPGVARAALRATAARSRASRRSCSPTLARASSGSTASPAASRPRRRGRRRRARARLADLRDAGCAATAARAARARRSSSCAEAVWAAEPARPLAAARPLLRQLGRRLRHADRDGGRRAGARASSAARSGRRCAWRATRSTSCSDPGAHDRAGRGRRDGRTGVPRPPRDRRLPPALAARIALRPAAARRARPAHAAHAAGHGRQVLRRSTTSRSGAATA